MAAADYVTISGNTVCNNTWWSSSASSGITVATLASSDRSPAVKITITNNTAFNNVNYIPFYNVLYRNASALAANQMSEARPYYGWPNQTQYIIDGHQRAGCAKD